MCFRKNTYKNENSIVSYDISCLFLSIHISYRLNSHIQGVGENQVKLQLTNTSKKCPELNIQYAVDGKCTDKYILCKNGVAMEKRCPDGLLFNKNVSVDAYPCQHPIDVNCTTPARANTVQLKKVCSHQFGYIKSGDASKCAEYMKCINGILQNFTCPHGLAFNPTTYQCDWPDLVEECDAEAFLQFKCPSDTHINGLGSTEIKLYKSNDCQRYIFCNKGRPRLLKCEGEGYAFNESLNRCEDAQNVAGCEHFALKKGVKKDETFIKILNMRVRGIYVSRILSRVLAFIFELIYFNREYSRLKKLWRVDKSP